MMISLDVILMAFAAMTLVWAIGATCLLSWLAVWWLIGKVKGVL